MTLTQRLTLILVMLIGLTAVAAVVPVYLIVRHELHQQMWQRLDDARQHSIALLAFEQAQLRNLVELTSERPTLRELLEADDRPALEEYLREFRANTPLNYLAVEYRGETSGEQPPRDMMVISETITAENGAVIRGAIALDEQFAQRLQLQTGFLYRFLPYTEANGSFTHTTGDTTYYGITLPLQPLANITVEILLPVSGVLEAEQRALWVLIAVTSAIMGAASLVIGLYLRYQLRPLHQLTTAAKHMGQGDLTTPIIASANVPEIATLADVLEHNRAHLDQSLRELSSAKEWSEALIQSIAEGIITIDTRGRILFFSQGAARITQITPEEAVGQTLDTLFPLAEAHTGVFSDYIPATEARRTVSIRLAHRVITLAVTRARRSAQDQITLVMHDITEETQRRSLQTYFIANVSHEFRTPLAGMKVSIELLLENARFLSASEMDELLNSLYLSATSLQNLIDNLLESSKIEANHLTLRRQTVNFNQPLSEAIRLMQPFLTRKQQKLMLDQPLHMPTLRLDVTRTVQVLVNLLSNASKYSPMGSRIDVHIEPQDNRLHIAVMDQGEGIPEEERQDIFRQFVRLERAANADYGAGLGLAVVKAIVEAHGGNVGVDGREGSGAVVWFTLPLEDENESIGR